MSTLSGLSAHIRHLSQVLRGVRAVGRITATAKDPDELAQKTCELLVETRGFSAAWVLLLDEDRQIRTLARAGGGGFFEPVFEAVRSGEYPACLMNAAERHDTLLDADRFTFCAGCPVAGEAHGCGSLAVSLDHEGTLHGYLLAMPPDGLATDVEECALFAEMAEEALNQLLVTGRWVLPSGR